MSRLLLTAVVLTLTISSATGASGVPDKFWSTNPYRTSPLWISGRAWACLLRVKLLINV